MHIKKKGKGSSEKGVSNFQVDQLNAKLSFNACFFSLSSSSMDEEETTAS